jgi:ectoine hydroxylase-related dioxygenase (phytanoyl-CoA dioxygenase family)
MNELAEFRVSNDALGAPDELRRRFQDEGYVFIKGLLDRDQLLSLRREMMTTIQHGGWLVAGTDPADGIANLSARCTEGDLGYTEVYHAVYKLENFHRIAHSPELLEVLEALMGRPVMPHPQKIARLWFPQFTMHTTPVHQDFVHFQGNFETCTAWSPVGDCSTELGGLALLPGSHKVGTVLEHHFSLGAGGLSLDTASESTAHKEIDVPWHTTNYEVGDTLFFPALTVHKALENVTEDRLRLSLDNRYLAVGDAICDHMLEPHLVSETEPLSWDEVYEDWEHDDLKYYWKDFNFSVAKRDMSYADKGFSEALDLARQGDERAYVTLRRTIHRSPDSADAKAARAVLQEFGVAESFADS